MNDPSTDRSAHGGPGRSTDAVLAVLDRELSRSERLRYLTVGLASFVVTAVTGSLWATEASLPLRTHVAFAGIVVLGTAWMVVAVYVLTRRWCCRPDHRRGDHGVGRRRRGPTPRRATTP